MNAQTSHAQLKMGEVKFEMKDADIIQENYINYKSFMISDIDRFIKWDENPT